MEAAAPPYSVVNNDEEEEEEEEEEYALASSAVNQMPPGFRFHPTDWEIIDYLLNKIIDTRFRAVAIGEIDLNKCEPWDLPQKAPKMGEKEWFFFFEKETKYPSGMRTNRATASGYWKATGKDKEIHKGKMGIVGMKKTLVFYKGRAPKGEKTNWIIHEYRLKGEFSAYNLSPDAKEKWVVCRVFHKKNVQTNPSHVELSRIDSFVDHYLVDSPTPLPPLTDYSSSSLTGKPTSTSAAQETDDEIKPTSYKTCSSTLMLNTNKLQELQHHHQNNFLHPHLKINNYNQYYSTLHNLNPEPDYSTQLGHINSFLPYESPSLAYQHQDGLSSSSMMEWYLANFPIKGGGEKPDSRILAPDIYIGGKEPENVCKMEPISFNNSEISTEVAAAEMNCEKEIESKNAVAEDLCFSPNISELDSLWSY